MSEANSSSPGDEMRCGFVSVVGLPNAGKSTLINQLVGQKVSIVSKRVQTTRSRVLGIVIEGAAQVILIDTPGIFEARKTMERAMVGAAYDALEEGEIALHLVDASQSGARERNAELIKRLPQNKPVLLVLNKTDCVQKPDLLALASDFNAAFDYEATFMISALKGNGTQALLSHLAEEVKTGPWLFDEDQITDMPMRLMAAEITREKIFNQLYKELPTSCFVETEKWEDFDNGDVKIHQILYVERDSQKAIVLGRGGARIKQIGQAARKELEDILERRVHLKLFAKVKDNWSEEPEMLRLMGLIE
ncbi:MAG: GTPase Era [Alphaproteobacteria bacterium]|nr:GTPase Era [Alphaproteobacteria bacterium]